MRQISLQGSSSECRGVALRCVHKVLLFFFSNAVFKRPLWLWTLSPLRTKVQETPMPDNAGATAQDSIQDAAPHLSIPSSLVMKTPPRLLLRSHPSRLHDWPLVQASTAPPSKLRAYKYVASGRRMCDPSQTECPLTTQHSPVATVIQEAIEKPRASLCLMTLFQTYLSPHWLQGCLRSVLTIKGFEGKMRPR